MSPWSPADEVVGNLAAEGEIGAHEFVPRHVVHFRVELLEIAHRAFKAVKPPRRHRPNRQRVNNDRSAYTQQGLRPAGGEPWRGHAGGVDESFFWGGSTGKRAW